MDKSSCSAVCHETVFPHGKCFRRNDGHPWVPSDFLLKWEHFGRLLGLALLARLAIICLGKLKHFGSFGLVLSQVLHSVPHPDIYVKSLNFLHGRPTAFSIEVQRGGPVLAAMCGCWSFSCVEQKKPGLATQKSDQNDQKQQTKHPHR